MVQYYLDMKDVTMLPKNTYFYSTSCQIVSSTLFYKKNFCHSRQILFRILSYFLLTVPGKTSKTDRNSCSHQLCECDREFAMCLQKYLPCPKSKAVCKNKKRLWQNLLMGFGSGKGVHDPKHKVCCLPSGFVCVMNLSENIWLVAQRYHLYYLCCWLWIEPVLWVVLVVSLRWQLVDLSHNQDCFWKY